MINILYSMGLIGKDLQNDIIRKMISLLTIIIQKPNISFCHAKVGIYLILIFSMKYKHTHTHFFNTYTRDVNFPFF